jgi:hypothetical protein
MERTKREITMKNITRMSPQRMRKHEIRENARSIASKHKSKQLLVQSLLQSRKTITGGTKILY